MNHVGRSLVSLMILGATSLTWAGCQTTNLAARKPPATLAEATCEKNVNSRKDCQDAAGCFWDYQQDACVASR